MVNIGDVWTTRVFRDQECRLRVFKIAVFLNLSVGVIDQEDPSNLRGPPGSEKIIWYAKSDLQFMDCLQMGKKPNEEGN